MFTLRRRLGEIPVPKVPTFETGKFRDAKLPELGRAMKNISELYGAQLIK